MLGLALRSDARLIGPDADPRFHLAVIHPGIQTTVSKSPASYPPGVPAPWSYRPGSLGPFLASLTLPSVPNLRSEQELESLTPLSVGRSFCRMVCGPGRRLAMSPRASHPPSRNGSRGRSVENSDTTPGFARRKIMAASGSQTQVYRHLDLVIPGS